MSTPAMRATCLVAPVSACSRVCSLGVSVSLRSALTLLVAGVVADHHDASVAADDLALLADRLDAGSHLHCLVLTGSPPVPYRCPGSLVAVGDATTAQVVGGDLHLHTVTGEDADAVHAHLSRAVGEHLVAVLELDPEHGVGERLDHRALEHDRILLGFGQVTPPR